MFRGFVSPMVDNLQTSDNKGFPFSLAGLFFKIKVKYLYNKVMFKQLDELSKKVEELKKESNRVLKMVQNFCNERKVTCSFSDDVNISINIVSITIHLEDDKVVSESIINEIINSTQAVTSFLFSNVEGSKGVTRIHFVSKIK